MTNAEYDVKFALDAVRFGRARADIYRADRAKFAALGDTDNVWLMDNYLEFNALVIDQWLAKAGKAELDLAA